MLINKEYMENNRFKAVKCHKPKNLNTVKLSKSFPILNTLSDFKLVYLLE